MRLSNYNSYKDSGIEWLGKIPMHWDTNRTTDICKNNKRKNKKLKEDNLLSLSYGCIVNKDINTAIGLLPANFSAYQIVEKGYIILRLTDLQNDKKSLRVGFAKERGIITSAYLGLNFNKKVNSKYSYYLLHCYDIKKVFYSQGGSMRQSMKFDDFKTIPHLTPPFFEQNAITNFLDKKTKAIDKKTDLLEQKILKYKELRKAIINNVFTRGLNKNIKLKERSIECIGEIPEHWKEIRMKDIGSLYSGLSGKSGTDFNQEQNENNRSFLPFTNIASNTYVKTNELGTVVINDGEKQNRVRKNDLFFLMSSEGYDDVGKSSLLDADISETYLNSFCKGFRILNKQIDPKYLNWLLLSTAYRENLITQGKGFTRINLKMDKINDFKISIPPTLSEQVEIVKFIDDKTTTIDSIIQNIEKQIVTLAELKKTLINDVVTGKLCVLNN